MAHLSDKNRYLMPAEWEPHAATWLAWPHYKLDWPGKFEPIPWVFAEVIRYLSRDERVELIVKDAAVEKLARKTLRLAHALNDKVGFHRWPTDRIWTRDSGCAFVFGAESARAVGSARAGTPVPPSSSSSLQGDAPVSTSMSLQGDAPISTSMSLQGGAPVPTLKENNRSRGQDRNEGGGTGVPARAEKTSPGSQLSAIKWRFNAWAKYPHWKHDEKIGSLMAQAADATEVQAILGKKRVVLEGGAIDVNGHGTLITTEECLLSRVQQRNPGMKKKDYEQVFSEYLGARNIIWLGSGIVGDDTHGHVDDITRFVSPDTVVTCVDADPGSENYEALRDNVRRLRDATVEDGKPLATVDLPMPAPVYFEGRRLPASYANFYIANRTVLVPVFNDPNDRVALDILADIFPDREVVGIYCGDLIWGFGAIHCMTQQQPMLP